MSPDDSTRAVEALNLLRNIPRKTLRPFKAELQAIMQNLDHNSSAVTHTPTNSVKELIEILTQNLEIIKTRLSELCVGSEPEWGKEDPRIVDIQIAGAGGKTSPVMKLRRILSQRSLAKEFWDWKKSKVKVKQGRRQGQMSKFLSVNTHRFCNVDVARRGIKYGQKLLTVEKSLGVGFSAILTFCFTRFEAVTYGQLNDLKKAINEQHLKVTDKQDSIKELAEQKTRWLNEQQRYYDEWYKKVKPSDDDNTQTAEAKRRLPDSSSSQPKRLKIPEPTPQEADLHHHIRTVSVPRRASAADPLAGPNSSKALQYWYCKGVLTSLQANVSRAFAPLPAPQTQSDVHKQCQRPPSPLPSSENNVSSGLCDGFNTNDPNGRAMGSVTHQSFNNSIQETQGSVLRTEDPMSEDQGNRSSRSSPPSTSFSTPMGPEHHRGQKHIYQGNMETDNLMGTDEQGQPHQLRLSLNGGQSNRDILPMDLLSEAANNASHRRYSFSRLNIIP